MTFHDIRVGMKFIIEASDETVEGRIISIRPKEGEPKSVTIKTECGNTFKIDLTRVTRLPPAHFIHDAPSGVQ